jgi:HD superfamily phosphodiesterase
MSTPAIYERIYAAAEPYWNTRENHVHVPAAYLICQELLESYPEADEAIVLPAILLHDVGYMEVPEDEQLQGLAGAPTGWRPEVTRRHEIAGARIAGEILGDLGYDPERTARIQEIIDGHDSRLEVLSIEDAIVKDADKVWRFTEDGITISARWMSRPLDEFTFYIESKIDEWMLTEAGKAMAHQTLVESRVALGLSGD